MRHLFSLLVFVTAACAGNVEAEALALRIFCYNIHHGEGMDGKADLDRIADIILAHNPDVVCLQEVDRHLSRTDRLDFPAILAEKTGMKAIFGANYRFDDGEYGNATLTRLDVVSWRNVALPNPKDKEPRGCLILTVRWEGREVDIMNTHLGLDAGERLAQAKAITTALRDVPTILAGDLNEQHNAPGLRHLLERFTDTYAPAPDMPAGTVPTTNPRRRIDFILATRHWDTVSFSIVDTPKTRIASDHLPCFAALRLLPQDAQGEGGEPEGR